MVDWVRVCSHNMESEHIIERIGLLYPGKNIPGIYSMTSPAFAVFEGGMAASVNLREGRVLWLDEEGKRCGSVQLRVADLLVRVYIFWTRRR